MKQQTSVRHGLMYSTAILLCVCGIPGSLVASLIMLLEGSMNGSEAFHFAGITVSAEAVLAASLWIAASRIAKSKAASRAS